MGHRFLEIVGTPAVKAAQAAHGSRAAYARMEGGVPRNDRLGAEEIEFVGGRDSIVMATVSATGWPYVQHRGGPAGFLKVLDDRTLGFADYRGNRQYVSLGNAAGNDRVALLLVDPAQRRRLKLLGRLEAVDLAADEALGLTLRDRDYPAIVERGWRIHVEAFDWNCPQHIVPRYTAAEVEVLAEPLRRRIERLEAEIERLHGMLQNPLQETTP